MDESTPSKTTPLLSDTSAMDNSKVSLKVDGEDVQLDEEQLEDIKNLLKATNSALASSSSNKLRSSSVSEDQKMINLKTIKDETANTSTQCSTKVKSKSPAVSRRRFSTRPESISQATSSLSNSSEDETAITTLSSTFRHPKHEHKLGDKEEEADNKPSKSDKLAARKKQLTDFRDRCQKSFQNFKKEQDDKRKKRREKKDLDDDAEGKPFDYNHYATKKTVGMALLDVCLIATQSAQLKAVIQNSADNQFAGFLITFLIFSLILQFIAGGILCIVGRTNLNTPSAAKRRWIDKYNNVAIGLILAITIVNIMIASFGVANNQKYLIQRKIIDEALRNPNNSIISLYRK